MSDYEKLGEALNISERAVPLRIDRSAGRKPIRYEVEPGKTVQIDPGYLARRARRGRVVPSIVERITKGKLVPLDSDEARAYLAKHHPELAADAGPHETVHELDEPVGDEPVGEGEAFDVPADDGKPKAAAKTKTKAGKGRGGKGKG